MLCSLEVIELPLPWVRREVLVLSIPKCTACAEVATLVSGNTGSTKCNHLRHFLCTIVGSLEPCVVVSFLPTFVLGTRLARLQPDSLSPPLLLFHGCQALHLHHALIILLSQ